MSEYQYYEFLALDRPLSTSEQSYIQTLSSRVQLTSNQAIFTYSYGDFRGDPQQVLEKCFDIMLYMANWGTRQLMFRLPTSLVDVSLLESYCLPDKISVATTDNHVILNINLDDEEYRDWIEAEGWLSKLVSLRNDLLSGDFRALYLAWLKAASLVMDEEEEDLVEPPVPANLPNLSIALKTFAEFFQINEDLIAAAAQVSVPQQEEIEPLTEWIAALSEEERNDFLLRVVKGEALVGMQLLKRLRELFSTQKIGNSSGKHQRSLSELLASAKQQKKYRQQQEQLDAQQAKIQKLEALAPREDKVWEDVFKLIDLKQAKSYDQAISHLIDLRDLAEYQGKLEDFQACIQQIQKDYSTCHGLLSRLRKAGLQRK
ncbi:MAG: hypothetical protein KME59_07850 [Trichormus sp. ATA11-4-KO1]|nr:hypothetical protein [Trichormus sp. ATA11-4-KO1]